MNNRITVRPFAESDAAQVRELFVSVNRLLAPEALKDSFETYIISSLAEEIDRIPDYYAERNGSFWIAESASKVAGMFGLEKSGPCAMELRRMYVAPDQRRQGIAGQMLEFAEDHCRGIGVDQLDLSTSEIQSDALSFYRSAGYELVREEVAEAANNKTIGGGIRRFYFTKHL